MSLTRPSTSACQTATAQVLDDHAVGVEHLSPASGRISTVGHLLRGGHLADDPGLQELFNAVAGGDRTALGQIYDVLAPAALTLARRLVPSESTAQQITVSAFTCLWEESPNEAQNRPHVTAWVLALVHRCAEPYR